MAIYVSEETGVYYDMWLDPEKENPIEGMQIWENKTQTWQIVSFYANYHQIFLITYSVFDL